MGPLLPIARVGLRLLWQARPYLVLASQGISLALTVHDIVRGFRYMRRRRP